MRRLNKFALFLNFKRFRFFHFNSNDESTYNSKARELKEKRDLALKYMGDVKLRKPIHDNIRKKIALNTTSLNDTDVSSILGSNAREDDSADVSCDELLDKIIQDLDENWDEELCHLPLDDSKFLRDEFISSSEKEEEETIRRWLKMRKVTSDYQNYMSVPEGERSLWSAWYLRHVSHSRKE